MSALTRVPYIIGEAGSCHMEEEKSAFVLIQTAAQSGCDAVKFQYWSSAQRMRGRRKVDVTRAYEHGSVKTGWVEGLLDFAHRSYLDFICSVYLPEDVETLAPYVDAWKISSFEASDRSLREAVMAYPKRTYISLGMAQFPEHPSEWIELHCVSAYPCPIDQANVLSVTCGDGYSDHTRNVLTGACAVSCGAEHLEVHFRLDETPSSCPDYPVSLTPEELRQYVDNARMAARLRGNGLRIIQPCEEASLKHRVMA